MARAADGRVVAWPIHGGDPEPIGGLESTDEPIGWAADSHTIFVAHRTATGWAVERLDPSTGRRDPWTEIRPREIAGLRLSMIEISPDGRSWVHSYSRMLTDLYLAEGLR